MTIDASSGSTGTFSETEPVGTAEKAGAEPDPPRAGRRFKRGGGRSSKTPAKKGKKGEGKRTFFILLGLALFSIIYFSPTPPDAVSPLGETFALSREGKLALGLFFLAATWWVTEVVPIGITAITIGVVQALFLIRPARDAFTDFMDPSVWFIIGSLMIGMTFTRTGLTRRMAYKMLGLVGERTSMIYLGCFVMTSALTLIMAHTAVAATVYPLLVAVYALYTDESGPTRFGKGLFMGMAFVAGAGSIITLLGAARGAVAIGFFAETTGRAIGFFELSYYMFPVGFLMTFLLWGYFMLIYPPERKTIPGLRERVAHLSESLGPVKRDEILAVVFIFSAIAVLSLRSFVPALGAVDKSVFILMPIILLFLFKVLSLDDLESTSWNIVFLFGGSHEHRALSLADGGRLVDGRALARPLRGGPLAPLRSGDGGLCAGHDELHHECGGHRHHHAGSAGHGALSGRGAGGHPLRLIGHGGECPSSSLWGPRPTPSPTPAVSSLPRNS